MKNNTPQPLEPSPERKRLARLLASLVVAKHKKNQEAKTKS